MLFFSSFGLYFLFDFKRKYILCLWGGERGLSFKPCVCVCVITMLIMPGCASVGCFLVSFVWPAWQNPAERQKWRETSEQCAEHVFFRTVWALFRQEGQLSDPDPRKEQLGRGTACVCMWPLRHGHTRSHVTLKHAFTFITSSTFQSHVIFHAGVSV